MVQCSHVYVCFHELKFNICAEVCPQIVDWSVGGTSYIGVKEHKSIGQDGTILFSRGLQIMTNTNDIYYTRESYDMYKYK